jgi:hypothetical protein
MLRFEKWARVAAGSRFPDTASRARLATICMFTTSCSVEFAPILFFVSVLASSCSSLPAKLRVCFDGILSLSWICCFTLAIVSDASTSSVMVFVASTSSVMVSYSTKISKPVRGRINRCRLDSATIVLAASMVLSAS